MRLKALNHISSLGTAGTSWLISGVDPIAKPPHHQGIRTRRYHGRTVASPD